MCSYPKIIGYLHREVCEVEELMRESRGRSDGGDVFERRVPLEIKIVDGGSSSQVVEYLERLGVRFSDLRTETGN